MKDSLAITAQAIPFFGHIAKKTDALPSESVYTNAKNLRK